MYPSTTTIKTSSPRPNIVSVRHSKSYLSGVGFSELRRGYSSVSAAVVSIVHVLNRSCLSLNSKKKAPQRLVWVVPPAGLYSPFFYNFPELISKRRSAAKTSLVVANASFELND
ncbi:uncharacterized protein LY89DRAFT_155018 [Mollisia scopiformis]|uniref:Uncharacterized protein n=1 Tax=Mollisia scopiformis TaxID=149040 RepID=A0A194WZ28_MOLSC|nr:uncharacterized protein LY89DRAFT_155018 [Mollisia scopiformis]KUJ13211.1 hypothetical protein LY89DRAFT_155018 [Mollisia scopiformis]